MPITAIAPPCRNALRVMLISQFHLDFALGRDPSATLRQAFARAEQPSPLLSSRALQPCHHALSTLVITSKARDLLSSPSGDSLRREPTTSANKSRFLAPTQALVMTN